VNPDSLDLIEGLIERVESTGAKVTGASLIRSYSNRVLQWRAVLVLLVSTRSGDFHSQELNGYGSNGRDAIAAMTREAEVLLQQWALTRRSSPSGA